MGIGGHGWLCAFTIHRFVDLDEVSTMSTLHLDRTADDLFVGDLVLRLAARTEELHAVASADAPMRGTDVESLQSKVTFTTGSIGGP
jgi:hypothetical protein